MMILESGLESVSTSQLQMMLEMPCVNFFSVDEEHRYTFFTNSHARAIRELWGVDVSIGTNFLSEIVRETHDRAKVTNSFYWAQAGNDFTVTEALGTPNRRRLYENRYCPSKSESGKVNGVTVYMTDVTDRFQVESERRALDRKLLESSHFASLGLMVGCVTHDFNNLLLPVLLNAELALKTVEPSHPANEMLREVITSVGCASALTKQLLSLSGAAEDADKEVVDLNEVVKSVSELSRVSIGRRAELSKSLDTTPLLINANETQLRQVIVNLLTNASEAGRTSPLQITVETSSVVITGPIRTQRIYTSTPPSGEFAVLTVHDDGCGMNSEQLDRIFQPFYSTKGDGRGLGLTAVKCIVDQHRGFLSIDSTPGVGSTFRVGFPMAKLPAVGCTIDEAAMLLDEITPFQPLRLLIVDDNPNSLRAISSVCSYLGHSVAVAANEAVALSSIIGGQFDLVLLDADMSNQSCSRILDTIPEYLLTPVVLTSATAQHGTMIDKPRVHSVLTKPFSTASLVSTLRRIQSTATGDVNGGRNTRAATNR